MAVIRAPVDRCSLGSRSRKREKNEVNPHPVTFLPVSRVWKSSEWDEGRGNGLWIELSFFLVYAFEPFFFFSYSAFPSSSSLLCLVVPSHLHMGLQRVKPLLFTEKSPSVEERLRKIINKHFYRFSSHSTAPQAPLIPTSS